MKSLYKLAKAAGATRSNTTGPNDLSYSCVKSGEGHALMFTIGCQLRKTMRWIKGDRIDILYDSEMAEGQLVRCREGGWALSDATHENDAGRLRVHLRPEFEMPLVNEMTRLAYDTTDNTIYFTLPTSYRKAKSVVPKP